MKKLAYLLSIIFHPLILPTYAIAILVITNPYLFGKLNPAVFGIAVIPTIINTLIFPVICILLLKLLGYVQSLNMETNQERYIPYICCMSFYFWNYIVYRKMDIPVILNVALLGSCITLAAVFVINIFRKISIHTAGMGCLIGLMLGNAFLSTYNLSWLIALTCLIAGLIGSARLLLKSHTSSEIYLGYFIGFIAQLVAFRFR